MKTNQAIDKYAKLYRSALREQGIQAVEEKTAQYRKRLSEMYASQKYREYNVYPTMDVQLIYAVIAMCLELRSFGFSKQEIMAFSDRMFKKRKQVFARIIRLIDRLPNSWRIARKWNINDHAKRDRDHSITYEVFDAEEDRIEYRISHCMYVEMFAYYGIRELCKIFCNTDTQAYAGLTRHVRFVRHSDLSDGDCCWDEVHRR